MGKRKRLREAEELLLLPSPKLQAKERRDQSNFQAAVTTYNRFLPLSDLDVANNIPKSQNTTLHNCNLTSTPVKGGPNVDGKKIRDKENQLGNESSHLQLVIRTLDCIFKKIDFLTCSISKLTEKVMDMDAKIALNNNYQRGPPVIAPPNSGAKGMRKYKLNDLMCKQNLTLQPKKVCLTIRSEIWDWSSLEGAKTALSKILRISIVHIDLHALLPLTQSNGPYKVILAFRSLRLPLLIIRQKWKFIKTKIIPTRVFADSIVKPLLVEKEKEILDSGTSSTKSPKRCCLPHRERRRWPAVHNQERTWVVPEYLMMKAPL